MDLSGWAASASRKPAIQESNRCGSETLKSQQPLPGKEEAVEKPEAL
jgi:hypothetical protein